MDKLLKFNNFTKNQYFKLKKKIKKINKTYQIHKNQYSNYKTDTTYYFTKLIFLVITQVILYKLSKINTSSNNKSKIYIFTQIHNSCCKTSKTFIPLIFS